LAAATSKLNIQKGNDVFSERLQCRDFRNLMFTGPGIIAIVEE